MAIKETAQLKKLDFQKQLAFAYLSCERFYPNYLYFSDNYDFGNPTNVRAAINFIRDGIFDNIDKQKIDSIQQAIEDNTPRTENFVTFYATNAMYAAGIIYESVGLLKHQDSSRILDDISTMCSDSVDLFIQERDDMEYGDTDFGAKILNDHVMQQELAIQKGIILYLSKVDQLTSSDVDTLLELQKEGTGNLILHEQ